MRPKLIRSPEALLDYFIKYEEWVKKNPFLVHDFVGKDAVEVRRQRDRPLSWIGFEGWLAKNNIVSHLGHYEQNSREAYGDYLPIIARIKAQCKANIVDGALAGVFQHNLAARVEGISEITDVNVNTQRKTIADLFPLDEEK